MIANLTSFRGSSPGTHCPRGSCLAGPKHWLTPQTTRRRSASISQNLCRGRALETADRRQEPPGSAFRGRSLGTRNASQRTIKRFEHNSHPAASCHSQSIVVPQPTDGARFEDHVFGCGLNPACIFLPEAPQIFHFCVRMVSWLCFALREDRSD